MIMGQKENGKIHGIWVKSCYKGNTNEPEVLREEVGEGGNGLHMDLKEHKHRSYVVYLMKQTNPGVHFSPQLLLLLLQSSVHSRFSFTCIYRVVHR